MLFGARYQLPTLSVQLGEAACDALHVSVEQAILVVLGIEVIFVTLPLVHGQQRYVLPVYTNAGGGPTFIKSHRCGLKSKRISLLTRHSQAWN